MEWISELSGEYSGIVVAVIALATAIVKLLQKRKGDKKWLEVILSVLNAVSVADKDAGKKKDA